MGFGSLLETRGLKQEQTRRWPNLFGIASERRKGSSTRGSAFETAWEIVLGDRETNS